MRTNQVFATRLRAAPGLIVSKNPVTLSADNHDGARHHTDGLLKAGEPWPMTPRMHNEILRVAGWAGPFFQDGTEAEDEGE